MRMSTEKSFYTCCFDTFESCKCIHIRQQIFMLTIGAAMHKQKLIFMQGHRKPSPKSFVLFG